MSINNESSYDAISDEFAGSRSTSSVPEKLVELVELIGGPGEILDLGCGSGMPIDKFLIEMGHKVTGVDISEKLIERARKEVPEALYIKSSMGEFKSSHQFDAVVAWDSLFHLEPAEQEPVFKMIGKLLKPEGYFLFTHGGSEGEIEGEMFGRQFTYSSPGPEKIKMLLTVAGSTVRSLELDNSEAKGYLICLAQKSK